MSRLQPASVTWGPPNMEDRHDASHLIVWDADSCGAALCSYLAIDACARAPIVVVTIALAVEEYELEHRIICWRSR